jgi:hypothetical protein
MALSKIDIANMVTGAVPVANGGTALTSGFVNGSDPRPLSKPIIINGDMAVAQRATSVTGHNAVSYTTVDRFKTVCEVGTYTVIQESLTSGAAYLAGFRNALRLDCTTAQATAGSAGDQTTVEQRIEGFNLSAFKKGTSSAEKYTLAFWVKASKTGSNLQVNLRDNTNDRQIGGTYSIASADTWEHKVINFAADTSGPFADVSTNELLIEWFLDGGSNYSGGAVPTAWEAKANGDRNVTNFDLAGNTANDWAITGIQLEVGEYSASNLPPFQFEDFGDNLARCQRYYFRNNAVDNIPFAAGVCNGTTNARAVLYFPQTMRAAPSLDKSGAGDFKVQIGSSVHDTTNTAFYYPNNDQALLYVDVSSGLTDGKGCLVIDDGGGSRYLEGSAEI